MDSSTAYLLIAAAFVVGYLLGRRAAPTATTAPVPPDREALEAVRPIYEREGKIAAIKAYRERTHVGLRDAKLALDTLGVRGLVRPGRSRSARTAWTHEGTRRISHLNWH